MAKFKSKTFKITIDDRDEAQEFLNGCILAKQNNNSAYFPQIIDAINVICEPYDRELQSELARGVAPDAKVTVE